MILVDSCIVIHVLENDRKWADWSLTQLETWSTLFGIPSPLNLQIRVLFLYNC